MPTDHTLHHMLASLPAVRGAASQAPAAETDDACDCGPSCDCATCGCGCG